MFIVKSDKASDCELRCSRGYQLETSGGLLTRPPTASCRGPNGRLTVDFQSGYHNTNVNTTLRISLIRSLDQDSV